MSNDQSPTTDCITPEEARELFGEPRDSVPVDQVELEAFMFQLWMSQEPLGRDFAKVLHDNAWSLYVRG